MGEGVLSLCLRLLEIVGESDFVLIVKSSCEAEFTREGDGPKSGVGGVGKFLKSLSTISGGLLRIEILLMVGSESQCWRGFVDDAFFALSFRIRVGFPGVE